MPCAGACSRGQYAEQVRAVQNFLEGSDTGLLARLCERMKTAADLRQFERAALCAMCGTRSIGWIGHSGGCAGAAEILVCVSGRDGRRASLLAGNTARPDSVRVARAVIGAGTANVAKASAADLCAAG